VTRPRRAGPRRRPARHGTAVDAPRRSRTVSSRRPVVPSVVAAQEVLAVVAAVRGTDDGVHVEQFGFVVVEEYALVAVVLDEQDRAVHLVVEGVAVGVAADPRDVGLVEAGRTLASTASAGPAGARPASIPIRSSSGSCCPDDRPSVRSPSQGMTRLSRPAPPLCRPSTKLTRSYGSSAERSERCSTARQSCGPVKLRRSARPASR
jgi:hypothetical protein